MKIEIVKEAANPLQDLFKTPRKTPCKNCPDYVFEIPSEVRERHKYCEACGAMHWVNKTGKLLLLPPEKTS
tara:strand:- start:21232 stop:21444 length:213 start_codon:yes stop_codon:yes gene_type:complete